MSSTHFQPGSHDAEQPRVAALTRSGRASSINGGLFALFAIELLLLGMVFWYSIVNRHSFPHSSSNLASPTWGLLGVVAAGWSTAYFVLAHWAAQQWNLSHSLKLLAIAITAGAILLGILLLNIARVFTANSVYMDVRPQYAAASSALPTVADAVIAGNAGDGKKWYGMSCVTCHGPTGDGVANAAPSLRTSEFRKTSDDSTIASLIRNGRAATDPANKTGKVMPAKGGNPFLDESKIADLVAFLKDLENQLPGGAATGGAGRGVSMGNLPSATTESPGEPLTVVREWTLEDLAGLDVTPTEELIGIGTQAFVKATCNKCHMAAVAGRELGPTLDQIAKKYPREKLLQHIVDPSLEINEKFQNHSFVLMDGRMVTGVIASETVERIELMTDLLNPEKLTTVPTDDIDDQAKAKLSPMPAGLLNVLTGKEIAGLVAYVDAVGSQMAAESAAPLNRWVVPVIASDPAPASLTTTVSTTSRSVTQSLSELIQSRNSVKYELSFSWLFVIATSVLAVHFLWVLGAGTAVVMHRELQLSSGVQLRLAQQAFLFWIVGAVWLSVWFVVFFLIG